MSDPNIKKRNKRRKRKGKSSASDAAGGAAAPPEEQANGQEKMPKVREQLRSHLVPTRIICLDVCPRSIAQSIIIYMDLDCFAVLSLGDDSLRVWTERGRE